jgi:hypothetical protein
MSSLCTVSRSRGSVSAKSRAASTVDGIWLAPHAGVVNSPQWSEHIVHTCSRSYKCYGHTRWSSADGPADTHLTKQRENPCAATVFAQSGDDSGTERDRRHASVSAPGQRQRGDATTDGDAVGHGDRTARRCRRASPPFARRTRCDAGFPYRSASRLAPTRTSDVDRARGSHWSPVSGWRRAMRLGWRRNDDSPPPGGAVQRRLVVGRIASPRTSDAKPRHPEPSELNQATWRPVTGNPVSRGPVRSNVASHVERSEVPPDTSPKPMSCPLRHVR